MTVSQSRHPVSRARRNKPVPSLLDTLRTHRPDPALLDRFDPAAPDRQWINLADALDEDVDLWLIHWPPGSRTDWHDHGLASGAFVVLQGTLTECVWSGVVHARTLSAGHHRTFGPSHIHNVINASGDPAISLHAYAPRLTTMTRYRLAGLHLQVTGVESAEGEWRGLR